MPQRHLDTNDYGRWPSALDADAMLRCSDDIAFLRPGRQGLFFLLSRPGEGNRLALMYRHDDGSLEEASCSGESLRSQVHEYGGLPYAVGEDCIYYCRFADQRIVARPWQPGTGQTGPVRLLSPDAGDNQLRYADLKLDPRRRRLLAVREDHRGPARHPRNTLVSIDLDAGGEGEILYGDSDFVAAPELSTDGHWLAFVSWSHPDMPWDHTALHVAALDESGNITQHRELAQPWPASVLQPRFSPDNELCLLADWHDWWNLYRVNGLQSAEDTPLTATAILPIEAECCSPPWQLGDHDYDFVDNERILVSINRNCFWELALLNRGSGHLQTLDKGLGRLSHLFHHRGRAVYRAGPVDAPPALRSVAIESVSPTPQPLFCCHSGVELRIEDTAIAEHLVFATEAGEQASALFYAPRNSRCRPPAGSRPPLLVFVHGGPSSSARASFNPAVQYWTTRGFAVVDVNHRGSTGYGRRFRRLLYGNWGQADIEDVVNAVRHLIQSERVDGARVAIRGGSAGGYAVLAALARSELFSAGTSYYGISDLSMLAADTHKFESCYLNQLIGPLPEAEALYRERSPIHQIDRIRAPVLLLQGMQDKIVPPDQAHMIFRKLQTRNPATRLLRFEGEAHGFRLPDNQIKALESELSFYRSELL